MNNSRNCKEAGRIELLSCPHPQGARPLFGREKAPSDLDLPAIIVRRGGMLCHATVRKENVRAHAARAGQITLGKQSRVNRRNKFLM